jgi:hypothetical protein
MMPEILASKMTLNLNDCKIEDTSWIKPENM